MSEEKKADGKTLSDETVKAVSGGLEEHDDPFFTFFHANCLCCRLTADCVYGSFEHAFELLGSRPDAVCFGKYLDP